jgi:hypothetical protein
MKTTRQIREAFSKGLIKKAIDIAKSSGGDFTKAYKEIEKIKKGLGDYHIVANALKKANEGLEENCGCPDHDKHEDCVDGCKCPMNEAVDCRTKDFKTALKRAESRKVKREASKLSEVDKIMIRTNRSLSGMSETMVAGGSDATGDIAGKDMPLGKVKKRRGFKETVVDEDYYSVQYYDKKGNAEEGKNKTFKQSSKAQAYAKKGNAIEKSGGMYKVFMVKGSLN